MTGDVIFLLDVEQDGEYRFNTVNPAFLTSTGLPIEFVVGKSVKEVIPEPSLTLVLSKYRQAVQEKIIVRWEETSDYPTGKRSALVTIAPILDADGICQHLVGNVHDITDRKRAEEALRENKQLLEMTFLSLHEAVFIIDATNVEILDCNTAASEIFGYSREEMLGRTTTFLHVDEASLEEFRARLYPAVEGKGYLFLPEFKMKRKDGTVFLTEHSVTPLENKHGQRIGWVSVIRDLTEIKRTETALRESEARFRDFAELLPEIVFEIDRTGHSHLLEPECL